MPLGLPDRPGSARIWEAKIGIPAAGNWCDHSESASGSLVTVATIARCTSGLNLNDPTAWHTGPPLHY
jgi:hypothetical protein